MEAATTRPGRVPVTFWPLLALVVFTAIDGFGSPFDLFIVATLGAALGGATARGSRVLGGAALGLGVVFLALVLVEAGDADLASVWPIAAYELVVGALFAMLGWRAADPTRSTGGLIAIAVTGAALAVLAAAVGFVGLFALACEGGC